VNTPVTPAPLDDPWTMPIERIDVGNPKLFQDGVWEPYFARLRRDDPVHFADSGEFGQFWSITKYKDIMEVDTSHQRFSSDSALGGITLADQPTEYRLAMFIAMDPPRHDEQRKVVAPIVAPANLMNMAPIIRERAGRILDRLPRNETFDWVDLVSIELTTQMLATLFDFPFEERRKLTWWSNVATTDSRASDAPVKSEEERVAELRKMAEAFTAHWNERINAPPRYDLISMLAHGESTRNMQPQEFMGNLVLLIVGGNDTTRNSISGGLWALSKHPIEYRKLRENHDLIVSMVPEIIRWQTPLAHMRRTALVDTEVGGKHIKAGDKLAMWYISGNRDEEEIERANEFIIDRARPRHHLSFGFGIHRCVGNRLAELQLTILWEEIMKRFAVIELMDEPKRIYSTFVHGIASMPVRIPGSRKSRSAVGLVDSTRPTNSMTRSLPEQPSIADALFLRGELHAGRGDKARALTFLDRAVAARPRFAAALNARGVVLASLGRTADARADFDAAVSAAPNLPDAWCNRGIVSWRLGELEEAVTSYDKALQFCPNHLRTLLCRGLVLLRLDRPAEAIESLARLLAEAPDHADALVARATALQSLNCENDSLDSLRRALAAQPNHPRALTALGTQLLDRGEAAQALAHFDRTLLVAPGSGAVQARRGHALQALGRTAEALEALCTATAMEPANAEAWSFLGFLRLSQQQPKAALDCCDRALALRPDLSDALHHRAIALQNLGRFLEAAEAYRRALEVLSGSPELWLNYGFLLMFVKRPDAAFAAFTRVAALRPDQDDILGWALHAQLQACDWTDLDARITALTEAVVAGRRAATPFTFLSMSQSAALHVRCALTFLERHYPNAHQAPWHPGWHDRGPGDPNRIRLAYVSADFRNHPTTHLLTELIELHDRTKFEVIGVSIAGGDASAAGRRIRAAFDRHIDVNGLSDADASNRLRCVGADIAIDLMGYTRSARFALFMQRPAPIQVQYIGHPVFGAVCMDYIMADRIVVPPEHEALLSDNIVCLPDTMQVNDRQRPISDRIPSRADVGLPEEGFVFCCFNNSYKLTPMFFDLWMRLLRSVDGSVLWLLEDNPVASRNLRAEATARSVSPDRLVFAPRVELADHLARNRLADLVVDTLPVNACTTASDALWAGVPVVTILGESFTARIGGSLLQAMGLPELITTSLAEYEALCLHLACSPQALAKLRRRMAEQRDTAPLFDTNRYCRHIEAAYAMMWQRHDNGQPPAGFSVPQLA
jgi:predicted O-linked N-acetylglucosamine transferase (SPINDLY family)/cytochrome P450